MKTFVGKKDAIVIKDLLRKLQFKRSEEGVQDMIDHILNHMLVCDDDEFNRYLNNEWFSCIRLWVHAFRQEYDKKIDATNISESWNKLSCMH